MCTILKLFNADFYFVVIYFPSDQFWLGSFPKLFYGFHEYPLESYLKDLLHSYKIRQHTQLFLHATLMTVVLVMTFMK